MSILLPHWQVLFGTVTTIFLSIDTESINFDHHLRCVGWLNCEFSKREKHLGRAITTGTLASACYHTCKCISVVNTIYTLAHICKCCEYYHIGKYLSILLPLFLVFASTVGKCLSILLLHWQVYISAVTTLASIYKYCYHISKSNSALVP